MKVYGFSCAGKKKNATEHKINYMLSYSALLNV